MGDTVPVHAGAHPPGPNTADTSDPTEAMELDGMPNAGMNVLRGSLLITSGVSDDNEFHDDDDSRHSWDDGDDDEFYEDYTEDDASEYDYEDFEIMSPIAYSYLEGSATAPVRLAVGTFKQWDMVNLAFMTTFKLNEERKLKNFNILKLVVMQNALRFVYNKLKPMQEGDGDPEADTDEETEANGSDSAEQMVPDSVSAANISTFNERTRYRSKSLFVVKHSWDFGIESDVRGYSSDGDANTRIKLRSSLLVRIKQKTATLPRSQLQVVTGMDEIIQEGNLKPTQRVAPFVIPARSSSTVFGGVSYGNELRSVMPGNAQSTPSLIVAPRRSASDIVRRDQAFLVSLRKSDSDIMKNLPPPPPGDEDGSNSNSRSVFGSVTRKLSGKFASVFGKKAQDGLPSTLGMDAVVPEQNSGSRFNFSGYPFASRKTSGDIDTAISPVSKSFSFPAKDLSGSFQFINSMYSPKPVSFPASVSSLPFQNGISVSALVEALPPTVFDFANETPATVDEEIPTLQKLRRKSVESRSNQKSRLSMYSSVGDRFMDETIDGVTRNLNLSRKSLRSESRASGRSGTGRSGNSRSANGRRSGNGRSGNGRATDGRNDRHGRQSVAGPQPPIPERKTSRALSQDFEYGDNPIVVSLARSDSLTSGTVQHVVPPRRDSVIMRQISYIGDGSQSVSVSAITPVAAVGTSLPSVVIPVPAGTRAFVPPTGVAGRKYAPIVKVDTPAPAAVGGKSLNPNVHRLSGGGAGADSGAAAAKNPPIPKRSSSRHMDT
ncbi:hypothetical protein HDU83_000120 [Entophlyctis luteolus]|nr:hypothetical protein HDU83_000120 [Entophlyctis luteolus]